MDDRPRRRLAFVVRFWFEPTETGLGQWRGVVQTLDGERRRYFSDLSDAVDFLRTSMKGEDPVP